MRERLERYTDDVVRVKLTEAIRRVILLLEGEKHPDFILQALLLSVGIDPINGNGTATNVSSMLKISRQNFYYYTKTISKRMRAKIEKLQKDPNHPFKL